MSITRGQPSIGFSPEETDQVDDGSLPSSLDIRSVEDHIQYMLDKFDEMDVLVQGKANKDELRTLISYSDEAIRIQAQDIALVGEVTLAAVERERNGTGPGNIDISITRIVGDVIKTGNILSNNWGTDDGTNLDLNNGTITIGGSNDPVLFFDGSTGDLTIAGTITAASFIEQDTTIQGDGRTLADTLTQLDNKLTETALSNGVSAVLAGSGEDFELDVRNARIIAAHKDALLSGLGSGYSGTLRTGLAVTANGVAAGYNRKSDGAWVDSFAIDGTTGDASFAGTITADSIIANQATVDGTQVVTVRDNADTGATHAGVSGNPHSTSLSQVNGDLDDIADGSTHFKSTADQNTGGTRAFNALDSDFEYIQALSTQKIAVSGANPTSGLVIDANGLRGYAGGNQQFNIPTDGSAVTFSGDVSTSGQVLADGSTSGGGRIATIIGDGQPGNRDGVAGLSDFDSNSVGVIGIHFHSGYGLAGQTRGGGVGVQADNYDQDGTGIALQAISHGSGLAADIDGDADISGDLAVGQNLSVLGSITGIIPLDQIQVSASTEVKFQFSTDGGDTWTDIHLRRVIW